VIAIHAEPDGLNINDNCGSTHLESLRERVLAEGADLGLGHDGDADRCLAITAAGEVVDGDEIMAILALAMRDAGTLTDNTLVATVMSNLGLRLAMKRENIRLIEAKVADRAAGAAAPTVQAAVALAENELGESGRVLLRPSGTEHLVRVMVEAASEEQARAVAERIAEEVRTASPV
jgi:phosphomannomutase